MARPNARSKTAAKAAPPPPPSPSDFSSPRSPSFSSSSDSDADSLRDPAAPHPTLHRILCLRCAKRLEKDPSVECEFANPRSAKCTRCVGQKNRCLPIQPQDVPAARALLGLQATFITDPTPARRDAVVVTARALTTTVETEARREPRSTRDIGLALLREQRETNRLLGLLLARSSEGEKGKKRKRGD